MTTIEDIRKAAAEHKISHSGFLPNIYDDGPVWRDDDVKMVDHCRAFIRSSDRRLYKGAEYSGVLKHHAERWRGEGCALGLSYVTNGAFLVACFREGLTPRRSWHEDVSGRRVTLGGKVRLP